MEFQLKKLSYLSYYEIMEKWLISCLFIPRKEGYKSLVVVTKIDPFFTPLAHNLFQILSKNFGSIQYPFFLKHLTGSAIYIHYSSKFLEAQFLSNYIDITDTLPHSWDV